MYPFDRSGEAFNLRHFPPSFWVAGCPAVGELVSTINWFSVSLVIVLAIGINHTVFTSIRRPLGQTRIFIALKEAPPSQTMYFRGWNTHYYGFPKEKIATSLSGLADAIQSLANIGLPAVFINVVSPHDVLQLSAGTRDRRRHFSTDQYRPIAKYT